MANNTRSMFICSVCGKEYKHNRNKEYSTDKCSSCFTKFIKQLFVNYFGGKCQHCGYNKCIQVLGFHHLDPSKKEFIISGSYVKPWKLLKEELDKCIMLCSNCHIELHYGYISLSDINVVNKELYSSEILAYENEMKERRYSLEIAKKKHLCKTCGKKIGPGTKNSLCPDCFHVSKRKVERPSHSELLELLSEHSFCEVGRRFGVSDNAIRKWLKIPS